MPAHPHILFVCYEDTTPRFGAHGDPVAETPHFDRIAREGCRFNQCFGNSPISAPSRSSVFTGMYPTTLHCQHMRTTHTNAHAPEMPTPYVAVPPPNAKCFTEYLRALGYYCTAQGKPDFQFTRHIGEYPFTSFDRVIPPMPTNAVNGSWGEIPEPAWRDRPEGAPFFAYYNLDASHESGMWPREDRLEPETDPAAVTVPPYLPDTLPVRKAIARQYDNLKKDDLELGHLIRFLEEDGLLDDTIILIWADHGEGAPRAKRQVHTQGLHLPLVIRYPEKIAPGTVRDDVVSNIDIPPTLFALAGIPIPAHFHGIPVAGEQAQERRHAYGGRDRVGEGYSRSRSVRDARYTYIENSYPYLEPYAWEEYRNVHPGFQELFRLQAAGQLDPLAQRLFFDLAPPVELYDRENDPWETENLADRPEHRGRVREFRKLQEAFERDYEPYANLSEEMLKRLQTPSGEMGVTTPPRFIPLGEHVSARAPLRHGDSVKGPILLQLSCGTHGASIGYTLRKLTEHDLPGQPWERDREPVDLNICWPADPHSEAEPAWQLYSRALRLTSGVYRVEAKAVRYGYQESKPTRLIFRVE